MLTGRMSKSTIKGEKWRQRETLNLFFILFSKQPDRHRECHLCAIVAAVWTASDASMSAP